MDNNRKRYKRRVKSHPNCRDLSGRTFGKLTVLRRAADYIAPRGHVSVMWECRCSCGATKAIRASSLTSPRYATISCGCDRKARNYTKNGASFHPLWNTWNAMLDRCYLSSAASYYLYGGRGIRVCRRWRKSFWDFASDMGLRPQGFTLDRINVNGNYEPKNCRWADSETQILGKRNTHKVKLFGRLCIFSRAIKQLGFKPVSAFSRIRKRGLTPQEVVDLYLAECQ